MTTTHAVTSRHKECIKKFFGTYNFPDVSNFENKLERIIVDNIRNNFSITGVQNKILLGLKKDRVNRTFGFSSGGTDYFIKTADAKIPYITECEQLIMLLANEIGLETVKHGLIKTKNNGYLYISKRIDRIKNEKLPMEDFCQLSNKLTEYKYNGSYEKCVKDVIDKYSSRKSLDTIEFFRVVYFSYLVGNTDMNLKNFSLIDDDEGNHLAPFYDLVSALVLVDQEEMALSLNGKRKNLTKNDFINFASNISLSKGLALRLMKEINIKLNNCYESFINNSLISNELRKKLSKFIDDRLSQMSF